VRTLDLRATHIIFLPPHGRITSWVTLPGMGTAATTSMWLYCEGGAAVQASIPTTTDVRQLEKDR
jgi:hypothetical protein